MYIPNLARLRLRLGLSQAKLARRAEIDRELISQVERGQSIEDVSAEKIRTALERLGVPEKEIIVQNEGPILPPPPPPPPPEGK